MDNRPEKSITLDMIIPLYNEAAAVDELCQSLNDSFSATKMTEAGISKVRYLMVDDGSTDQTAAKVKSHIDNGLPAILIRLSRNFGHQCALSAGLDHADADLVAALDADGQDPPPIVYQMIEYWRQGYDVVYGVRRNRKEHWLKQLGCTLFYRMVAALAEIHIPADSGDFCLMDQRVIQAIKSMPEKLRYIRIMRAWVGFKQIGLEYDRPARLAGRSKYNWSKLYKLATDGIASASIRPLKLAQIASFSFFILAVLILLGAVGVSLCCEQSRLSPAMWLLIILTAFGYAVITFCIYILGAYIGRTYLEVKDRPTYLVMEKIESEEKK